jgi:hypothetical protein
MFTVMKREIGQAWNDSAILTATSMGMLVAFLLSVAGVVLDDRVIAGAPAWLKPAKFAISTAIFCGTIAWLYRYLNVWPRLLRFLAWFISLVLILEVAIIDIQAGRGVTSHFNVSTTLDGALFSIMGTAIALLWLASIGVLLALFRQHFDSATWGWSLRLGMLITVLGAAMGGMMVPPNPEQLAAMRNGQRVLSVGAHTVGAPDGGPGMPGVGWSISHGDLRIPHFLGLHGLQIVPLIGWLLLRRRDVRVATISIVAISYVGLIGLLTWQALRGQSLIDPDGTTLSALGVWVVASAAALLTTRPKRVGSLSTCR